MAARVCRSSCWIAARGDEPALAITHSRATLGANTAGARCFEPTEDNTLLHCKQIENDRCTSTAACREASTGALRLARWAAPAFPGRSAPSARERTRHCPGVTPGGEAPDSGRRGEPQLVGNLGGRSASRQEVGPKPTLTGGLKTACTNTEDDDDSQLLTR